MEELPETHPGFSAWRRSLRVNDAQARAAKFAPSPAVMADPIPEALPPEPDPRDAEIARLRAENEALRSAEEPRLPDMGERLSDYAPVGDGEDFAGVFPTWLLAEEREGEDVSARISRLTETFRLRVNELTNLLLDGVITPEQEAERDRLLTQYDELAKLGDRI